MRVQHLRTYCAQLVIQLPCSALLLLHNCSFSFGQVVVLDVLDTLDASTARASRATYRRSGFGRCSHSNCCKRRRRLQLRLFYSGTHHWSFVCTVTQHTREYGECPYSHGLSRGAPPHAHLPSRQAASRARASRFWLFWFESNRHCNSFPLRAQTERENLTGAPEIHQFFES